MRVEIFPMFHKAYIIWKMEGPCFLEIFLTKALIFSASAVYPSIRRIREDTPSNIINYSCIYLLSAHDSLFRISQYIWQYKDFMNKFRL